VDRRLYISLIFSSNVSFMTINCVSEKVAVKKKAFLIFVFCDFVKHIVRC
jgi:hypothetical protein